MQRDPQPTTIRGVTYPSLAEAARALGVAASTVRHARDRGTLDRVGLGRHYPETPVTIRGVTYPSVKAAAEACDVLPEAIRYARCRGRLDGVGKKRKPVTIEGKHFRSMSEAGRHFGLSYAKIKILVDEGGGS